MSNTTPHYLFLTTSTREAATWATPVAGPAGRRRAARGHGANLAPPGAHEPAAVCGPAPHRGHPRARGRSENLLDATLAATHIVFVSPVYWFSIPSPLKTYLDHWAAGCACRACPSKEQMAAKSLFLITTSGDRAKAQPMIDSVELCAKFLSMPWGGALWGRAAARCGAGGCAGRGTGRALLLSK